MNEVVTKALVLNWTEQGEKDARITLFTEELGKVSAKARSIRSVTAKLASHLQPLNLVTVRLVQKKGYQVVDALKHVSLKPKNPEHYTDLLAALNMIEALTNEENPDPELWEVVRSGKIIGKNILSVLGFDPEHATCYNCNQKNPKHFLLKPMQYACSPCLRKVQAKRPFSVA